MSDVDEPPRRRRTSTSSRSSAGAPDGATAVYRRKKLGAVDATPKIIAEYHGMRGWEPVKDQRLDPDTARSLLALGVSQVRIRRAFSTVEVTLRRYLGPAS
ncbi:hypothetical protein [Microbacterium sp. ABRD28]|uniref:hypothetical protein n=1 Tax=Microbacterium sp. ABRD28 TaxID=2268461 RepID=UPI000F54F281|nr:hypothetical protein [Microbacterium sp. ABRD28]AZC12446.1 hypothetical protein DT073_00810 [Microbacterium sp. ABRD28]